MNKLPTGDELRKLPLRAVVAFAARNSERVSSEYKHASKHEDYESNCALIDEAIRLSLQFAAGEEIDSQRAEQVEEEMVSAVIASKETEGSRRTATLAANAAYATISATNSAKFSTNSPNRIIDASKTIMAAVTAADTACSAVPLNKQAAIRDFTALNNLNLGAFPSLGLAVGVTAQGRFSRIMASLNSPVGTEMKKVGSAKPTEKAEKKTTKSKNIAKTEKAKQSKTITKRKTKKKDDSKEKENFKHSEERMSENCNQEMGIHQLYEAEQSKNEELEHIYELQIQSIQSELDRIVSEYNELIDRDPSRQNQKLNSTVKKVTDNLDEFKKQIANYKTQVRDNKKQFQKELERLCQEQEKERSGYEKRIEELTNQIETQSGSTAEAENLEKQLTAGRDHLKVAEQSLQQEKERLEEERRKFEEVRNLFLKETEKFQSEQDRFEKENEEIQAMKTQIQKERRELEEKHEALEQVHQSIEKDRVKLDSDRKGLETAQESECVNTEDLEEKIRSLEAERTKLLEQADQLIQQGQVGDLDLDTVVAQRQELENQSKWLKEEKKALQQVAAQLSATFRRYPILLSSY